MIVMTMTLVTVNDNDGDGDDKEEDEDEENNFGVHWSPVVFSSNIVEWDGDLQSIKTYNAVSWRLLRW